MAASKSEIREKLLNAAEYLESSLLKAKYTIKEKLHMRDPVMIMPYYGYGNDTCVFLKGRVLEKEKISEKKEGATNLRHLKNTYRRYESDEIPGILLRASYGGREMEVRTDEEGFFEIEFQFDSPIDYERTGNKIQLRLLETKTDNDIVEAEGTIFVPPEGSEFGIISDIDDTVLVSRITHFLGKLKLMLLNDASERSPFAGIAAFLRALRAGCDDRVSNPLFYVSGSEWNLFDLLVNFFRYHDIPEGPLFLRNKGIRFDKSKGASSTQEYKLEQIRHILKTFPNLKFICIGDSGQHDPEIYRQIVEENPGRILGIYIRDVSNEDRDAEVTQITEEVKRKGTEMLLIPETVSAARHAARMKWLNEDQLVQIEEECKKDDDS